MDTAGERLRATQTQQLPAEIERALGPLFKALPVEAAMPDLCPQRTARKKVIEVARRCLTEPALLRPGLEAGIWLYVDALERSHSISQGISNPTGSFWHAIMHRREGDFGNSKYWFRAAGSHPAMESIPNYEPFSLVDRVQAAALQNPIELVQMQREEWSALFTWCARNLYSEV